MTEQSILALDPLMRACAHGDRAAFQSLARLMGGRMFGLAYRMMNGDHAAAEDAVQEALIKLWVGAPHWRPTGKVDSYILTIVHHCCIDLYRARKITRPVPDDLATEGPDVTTTLIAQEEHAALLADIHRLPERQRHAVIMSYYGEETNREIGKMMKISEGAVESLLVRARRTLARDLRPLREQEESP